MGEEIIVTITDEDLGTVDCNIQQPELTETEIVVVENAYHGKSAYEIWLGLGNEGTIADFINSLTGPSGLQGPEGPQGDKGDAGTNGSNGAVGAQGPQGDPGPEITKYLVAVMAVSTAVSNNTTVYFGNKLATPSSEGRNRIYFRETLTIIAAEISGFSSTNGTNENISIYIRKNSNAATDTLIATVGVNTQERVYSNTALSIGIVSGDYIELKIVYPTWATPPGNTGYGGYIKIQIG